MDKPNGIIALAAIAIAVALVAYADALRHQAEARQLEAQACAVCVEMNNDCSAVCGAKSNENEDDR